MENRSGQQLSNYRFIRPIGQGGFAEVYLGEHISFKHRVAIKVLRTLLSQDDQESFLTGAGTIARLKHPHIMPVLQYGVHEGAPFLVMPYASGGTLRQRHPGSARLTPVTILPYIQQIAGALHYVHSEGIIHRGLRPENLLLDLNNNLFLSDFGLAIGQQSSRLQSMEGAADAAVYMAPELLQGKPCPASDQYALGIVVYEWLCGAVPFEGSFTEVTNKQLSAPPPAMKPPSVSPEVELVVMTALAKAPERRFASIQAFANAFEQAALLDEATVRAWPGLPTSLASPGTGQDMQATRPAPPLKPPSFSITATQPASPSTSSLLTTQPVPHEAQRRQRDPSPIRRAITIALVLLVIIGGTGFAYFGTILHPARLVAQSTATAQIVQAQQLYIKATSGTLLLDDPLSKNGNPKLWSVYANKNGGCTFTEGAFHADDLEPYLSQFCITIATFKDFAYQVQMTILKGDEGGLFFGEMLKNNLQVYRFAVDQGGLYHFDVGNHAIPAAFQTLLHRPSSAIKTGLNQSNLLTVIVQGNRTSLYINRQYVAEVPDSNSTTSFIGVLAWATPDPTEVAFSHVQVWRV